MKIVYFLFVSFLLTISVFAQFGSNENRITKPELFAEGIISTSEYNEFHISFTKDGNTAYFTRRIKDSPQKIYVSEFINGRWSAPQVASFSDNRDESAFIAPDGKTIYFGSTRPIPNNISKGNFDMNIWKTSIGGNGRGKPIPIQGKVNAFQSVGEEFPSSNESSLFTNDGENFYFSTQRKGTNGLDLYKSTLRDGEFTEPEKLTGEVNTEDFWESVAIARGSDRRC